MEEFLRDEKYYGVFDYDDELTPGSELKIGHTVVHDYYDNQIDLTPFISLGTEKIMKARKQSIEAEKMIFAKIRAVLKKLAEGKTDKPAPSKGANKKEEQSL